MLLFYGGFLQLTGKFPPPPLSREEFEIEKKLQIEEKNNEERGRGRGGSKRTCRVRIQKAAL
jgi:hypothetical protein